MKLYLLFIMSCSIFFVFSQKEYKGKVLDANTKLPLVGAVISYNNERVLTNNEGIFSLIILQHSNIDLIEISYIGYQNRKIKMDSKNLNQMSVIELTPKTHDLNDVVVSSGIENLIRKCVNKIPSNYPTGLLVLNGIMHLGFREEQIKPTAYKRTAIDAAIETVYPDYENNGHLPEVYLIENRIKTEKSTTKLRDTSRAVKNWYLPNDIVYNKALFLEQRLIKDFTYQLQGKYQWQGKTVFNIAFESKKGNKVKGFVLIDTATYAFVYFDYYAYNIRELFFKTIKQEHIIIKYALSENKWYLDEAEVICDYKLESNQTISHGSMLYKTLQIKRDKDTVLSYKDIIDLNEEARNYSKYVSDSNWATYASSLKKLKAGSRDTLLTNIHDSATNTINTNYAGTIHKQNNSVAAMIGSYDIGVLFTKLPISFSGYQSGIEKQISPMSEYAYGLLLIWKLHRNYFLEINASNNFGIGGMKASQYGLSLGKIINLSKTQRLSPILGYSHIFLKDKSSGQKANDGYGNIGLRYLPKLTSHISLLFEGDYYKQIIQNSSLIRTRDKNYSVSIGILLTRFN